jgi:3-oxoacyl-[acyl-carrier protein] reductase
VATFSRTSTEFVRRTSEEFGTDRFLFAELDAADPVALRKFVADIQNRFERIDALINNAAVAIDGVLALSRDEDIRKMLDVNLQAALILARECSRWMLLRNAGSIVNISSIIASRGFSGLATYAATKAGLIGMTRALARELGPRNIRVNAVAPGYLETDMSQTLSEFQRQQIIRRTPLGRLGTAADVVPWIEFLLSPQSRFVTGQVITIDGGATV